MSETPKASKKRKERLLLIDLRAIKDSDYDPVFAIHEEVFRSHIEKIWGWNEDWQCNNFSNNWKHSDTTCIESEGKIIGYIQKILFPDYILLQNLAITSAYQSRGVGAALVKEIQEEAHAQKLPIKISVFITNIDALRFYLKHGFLDTEITKEFRHMVWKPSAEIAPRSI